MSYGMHDYLADKAMQRDYGLRKKAGVLEFLGLKTKSDKPNPINITAAFNKGLNIKLNEEQEAYDRGAEVMHENGQPKLNHMGVPLDEEGNVDSSVDYEVDENGMPISTPIPIPTLRDRILAQVMRNKYAIGGALGAGGAGAAIGALSSNKNRLRNALLGGGIGAILGGVSGHIADRYIG
jgi:hypothetical protein